MVVWAATGKRDQSFLLFARFSEEGARMEHVYLNWKVGRGLD